MRQTSRLLLVWASLFYTAAGIRSQLQLEQNQSLDLGVDAGLISAAGEDISELHHIQRASQDTQQGHLLSSSIESLAQTFRIGTGRIYSSLRTAPLTTVRDLSSRALGKSENALVFVASFLGLLAFGSAIGMKFGHQHDAHSESGASVEVCKGISAERLYGPLILIYILSYSSQGILMEVYKDTVPNGVVMFRQSGLVLYAKLLCIAFGWGYMLGSQGIRGFQRCFEFRKIVKYSMPGLCFGLYEVLRVMALGVTSASVVQILLQFQLCPTAIVWSLVFQKPISWMERAILTSITVGCFGFAYTNETATSMGVLYTCLSMLASTMGCVLGEYLLKSEQGTSVVLQNTWSLPNEALAALLMMMYMEKGSNGFWATGAIELMKGWNSIVWSMCIAGAMHTLVSTTTVKICGSVVKTTASIISAICPTYVVMLLMGVESLHNPHKILFALVVLSAVATHVLRPTEQGK